MKEQKKILLTNDQLLDLLGVNRDVYELWHVRHIHDENKIYDNDRVEIVLIDKQEGE